MSPENPLLTDAAKDVPPKSSPAPEAGKQTASATNTDPVPDAGKPSGDKGDGDGKDSGRTLENVTGEFNRKFTDLRSEMSSGLAEMKGMLQGMQQNTAPATQAAPHINDMSVVELEALAPHVGDDQKPAYEQLLATKRNAESVNSQVDARFAEQSFKQTKSQADTEAFGAFPELHDPLSRVRQETNKVLNEMGASARNNPYALMHAAQSAGARLGIKAAPTQHNSFGGTVGGATAPPPANVETGAQPLSDAEMEPLNKSLASAMPGGKFTEEQKARIKKNSKLYRENRHLFIRQ